MLRFTRGDRSSNVTTGQPALELIAGAKGCRVFSIAIALASAAATVLGIGRPAAAGITPTSPQAFVNEDNGEVTASTTALAWGTPPTAPAKFLERWSSTGALGANFTFSWPKGLWLPNGQTLTVHNILGGALLDITTEIEEARS
jgi:hypothetical protein